MIKILVQYIALILLNEKKWMIQLKIKYIEFQKRIDSMSFKSKQKNIFTIKYTKNYSFK